VSIAAEDLTMAASQCPLNNNGVFYCGTTSLDPGNPLYDGLQCVGGSVRRFQGVSQATGIACDTGFVAQAGSGYFVSSGTYYFQYWSRDVSQPSACGSGANFSPALAVTMTPWTGAIQ